MQNDINVDKKTKLPNSNDLIEYNKKKLEKVTF